LLLNVALHGMEQAAGVRYRTTGVTAASTLNRSRRGWPGGWRREG
jgi:hypothetical protein